MKLSGQLKKVGNTLQPNKLGLDISQIRTPTPGLDFDADTRHKYRLQSLDLQNIEQATNSLSGRTSVNNDLNMLQPEDISYHEQQDSKVQIHDILEQSSGGTESKLSSLVTSHLTQNKRTPLELADISPQEVKRIISLFCTDIYQLIQNLQKKSIQYHQQKQTQMLQLALKHSATSLMKSESQALLFEQKNHLVTSIDEMKEQMLSLQRQAEEQLNVSDVAVIEVNPVIDYCLQTKIKSDFPKFERRQKKFECQIVEIQKSLSQLCVELSKDQAKVSYLISDIDNAVTRSQSVNVLAVRQQKSSQQTSNKSPAKSPAILGKQNNSPFQKKTLQNTMYGLNTQKRATSRGSVVAVGHSRVKTSQIGLKKIPEPQLAASKTEVQLPSDVRSQHTQRSSMQNILLSNDVISQSDEPSDHFQPAKSRESFTSVFQSLIFSSTYKLKSTFQQMQGLEQQHSIIEKDLLSLVEDLFYDNQQYLEKLKQILNNTRSSPVPENATSDNKFQQVMVNNEQLFSELQGFKEKYLEIHDQNLKLKQKIDDATGQNNAQESEGFGRLKIYSNDLCGNVDRFFNSMRNLQRSVNKGIDSSKQKEEFEFSKGTLQTSVLLVKQILDKLPLVSPKTPQKAQKQKTPTGSITRLSGGTKSFVKTSQGGLTTSSVSQQNNKLPELLSQVKSLTHQKQKLQESIEHQNQQHQQEQEKLRQILNQKQEALQKYAAQCSASIIRQSGSDQFILNIKRSLSQYPDLLSNIRFLESEFENKVKQNLIGVPINLQIDPQIRALKTEVFGQISHLTLNMEQQNDLLIQQLQIKEAAIDSLQKALQNDTSKMQRDRDLIHQVTEMQQDILKMEQHNVGKVEKLTQVVNAQKQQLFEAQTQITELQNLILEQENTQKSIKDLKAEVESEIAHGIQQQAIIDQLQNQALDSINAKQQMEMVMNVEQQCQQSNTTLQMIEIDQIYLDVLALKNELKCMQKNESFQMQEFKKAAADHEQILEITKIDYDQQLSELTKSYTLQLSQLQKYNEKEREEEIQKQQNLNSEISQQQQQISHLEGIILIQDKEIQDGLIQQKNLKTQIEHLELKTNDLQLQLQSVRASTNQESMSLNEQFKINESDYQARLYQNQTTIEQQQTELETLQSQQVESEKVIQALRNELKFLQANAAEQVQELKKAAADSEQILEITKIDFQQQLSELAQLNQLKLSQLQKKHDEERQDESKKLLDQNEKQMVQIQKLEQAVLTNNSGIDFYKNSIKNFQQTLTENEAKYKNLEQRHDLEQIKNQQEIDKLSEQLIVREKQVTQTQQLLNDCQSNLNDLKEENEMKNTQLLEMTELHDALKSQIKSAQIQIEKLTAQVNTQSADCNETEVLIKQFQVKLEIQEAQRIETEQLCQQKEAQLAVMSNKFIISEDIHSKLKQKTDCEKRLLACLHSHVRSILLSKVEALKEAQNQQVKLKNFLSSLISYWRKVIKQKLSVSEELSANLSAGLEQTKQELLASEDIRLKQQRQFEEKQIQLETHQQVRDQILIRQFQQKEAEQQQQIEQANELLEMMKSETKRVQDIKRNDQILELQQKVDQQKQTIGQLLKSAVDGRTQLIEKHNAELKAQNEQNSTKISQLEEQNLYLEQQLFGMDIDRKQTFDQMQNELQQVSSQLDASEKKVKSLEDKNQCDLVQYQETLHRQKMTAMQEIQSLNQKISVLYHQIQQTETQSVSDIESMHEKFTQKYRQEIKNLQDKIQSLEEQLCKGQSSLIYHLAIGLLLHQIKLQNQRVQQTELESEEVQIINQKLIREGQSGNFRQSQLETDLQVARDSLDQYKQNANKLLSQNMQKLGDMKQTEKEQLATIQHQEDIICTIQQQVTDFADRLNYQEMQNEKLQEELQNVQTELVQALISSSLKDEQLKGVQTRSTDINQQMQDSGSGDVKQLFSELVNNLPQLSNQNEEQVTLIAKMLGLAPETLLQSRAEQQKSSKKNKGKK